MFNLKFMCVHWVNNVCQLSYRCITVESRGAAATSIPSIIQGRFFAEKAFQYFQHFIQLHTWEPPSTTTPVFYWWRLCCCYWSKLELSALPKGTLMQVVEFKASLVHSLQSDFHSSSYWLWKPAAASLSPLTVIQTAGCQFSKLLLKSYFLAVNLHFKDVFPIRTDRDVERKSMNVKNYNNKKRLSCFVLSCGSVFVASWQINFQCEVY